MAYEEIRKRIAKLGAEHILDSLPSTKSVRWLQLTSASPPTALVLGTSKGRDILAYMLKFGDKPREVHYCYVPANRVNPTSSMQTILQDEVVRLPLDVPFKYNAETSKNGKRRFSMIVKWYFLAKGLIEGPFGDYDDYTKRFTFALRLIEEGQQAEKGSGNGRWSRRSPLNPAINEEIIGADDDDNVYRLRSGERVGNRTIKETDSPLSTRRRLPTSSERTPSPHDDNNDNDDNDEDSDEENRDLVKLRGYLDEHDALHLLENIPKADEVGFADQDFLPRALPKKLFVGHTNMDRNEIYAFMRPSKNHHEINYYIEHADGSYHHISADEAAKQQIYHPFNKTLSEISSEVDQCTRARMSLIIKWYFLAAGIAKNIVLRETKAYPERLRNALQHIAGRMDSIHSTMPSVSHRTKNAPPKVTDSSPVASPSKTRDTNNTTHQTPSSKRTAEDAGFETLARIFAQDQDLTKEINDADQELETLDMRRQVFEEKIEAQRKQFMDQWEEEQQDVMRRRNLLNQKRTDVRKRFKRQSLTMAGMEDGE